MTVRRTLLLILVALVFAACGGKNKVGSDVDVSKASGGGEGALGRETTTTAGAASATSTTATTVKSTTTTTRAATTTSTTTAAPSITVKIQSDTAQGGAFDPVSVQVPRGGTIRWVNSDATARSVVADNGSFTSPSIPPGGHFDYKTSAPGTVSYHDGTRPYAVASFQVY